MLQIVVIVVLIVVIAVLFIRRDFDIESYPNKFTSLYGIIIWNN